VSTALLPIKTLQSWWWWWWGGGDDILEHPGYNCRQAPVTQARKDLD
jgi:hypothetical protein